MKDSRISCPLRMLSASALITTAAVALFSFSAMSCDSSARPANIASEVKTVASPHASPSLSPCERIGEIRLLPHKDERVDDQAYNAIVAEGEKILPCLITKIVDTTEMPDPRQAPKVAGTRVGDVAFFLLVDLSKADFVELLPAAVRRAYETDGIYGYFRQIDESNNRRKLQQNVSEWYARKAKKEKES